MLIVLSTLCNVASAEECEEMHDGSTLQSACFIDRDTKKIEQEMNETLSLLSKSFLKMGYSTDNLKTSQETWISYRQHQCNVENEVFGGINSISWTQCANDLTSQRLKRLSELLEIVE